MYRYIGNKTAIIEPLLGILTEGLPTGAHFIDPMCGTASVSAALAEAGYRVTAADILTFPGYHAEVRLRMRKPPRFKLLGAEYFSVLDELNALPGSPGYYWKEYSEEGHPTNAEKPRLYFTAENAAHLDAIDSKMRLWKAEGKLSKEEWILLRHDLIMAVNKIANIAGTYGHYRSTFSKASLARLQLKPSKFNPWANASNKVLKGAAESITRHQKVDAIYLDPPYTKRQYGANYHLLETLAVGDNPQPIGESGLRDWWPQYSNFCSKRKIHQAFESVLSGGNYSTAFISYSEDGLIDAGELREILEMYGDVKMHTLSHKRFRSNQSRLSKSLLEYVFEVKPK